MEVKISHSRLNKGPEGKKVHGMFWGPMSQLVQLKHWGLKRDMAGETFWGLIDKSQAEAFPRHFHKACLVLLLLGPELVRVKKKLVLGSLKLCCQAKTLGLPFQTLPKARLPPISDFLLLKLSFCLLAGSWGQNCKHRRGFM